MRIFLGIILALAHFTATACSLSPGYVPFLVTPIAQKRGKPPKAPEIEVVSVRRGNIGDSGMCADLGLVVFRVKDRQRHTGYLFEVVEGSDKSEIIPNGIISSVEDSEFRFPWLDGATEYQEPIELKIKVTAISTLGVESQPSYFWFKDRGRFGWKH
ncbi:MAG: hypothetical protein K0U59_11580 [Gammaproteobacteria bacterium]|nr:hypothetical protein [Gammaproteobacteria bacterium]